MLICKPTTPLAVFQWIVSSALSSGATLIFGNTRQPAGSQPIRSARTWLPADEELIRSLKRN